MQLLLTHVATRSNLPLRWHDPGCTPNNFEFADIKLTAMISIHFIPKTKCMNRAGFSTSVTKETPTSLAKKLVSNALMSRDLSA